MRRADKDVFGPVFVLCLHPTGALTATALIPVDRGGRAFDVTFVTYGDDHALFGDEILDRDLIGGLDDFGTPVVPKLLLNLGQFLADDFRDLLRAGKN